MKKILILLILFFYKFLLTTGQSLEITGRIFDISDGKIISGVTIFLQPDYKGTSTNSLGEYSFMSSAGPKVITTRILGYKTSQIKFNLQNDTILNIQIQLSPFELNEVIIIGDSIRNLEISKLGNYTITPAAINEIPKHFSEPDLLKSIQMIPGVVSGKDGTSDIYIRGGGLGQNVVLANGCYFFLPGHLLGVISAYDLDFLNSAELVKDYFPPDLGGGAASVISLEFKKPWSDSLRFQLRFGLLSSGLIVESPASKFKWNLTAGLKRGNYSIYSPILKKIVASDVDNFLPPSNYTFYDSFIKLSHSSLLHGELTYLFFGNYDNGRDENKSKRQIGDTLIKNLEGISTGWNNMVHAFQWYPHLNKSMKLKLNLNYNRTAIGRKLYTESEIINGADNINKSKTLFSFYPSINNIGTSLTINSDKEKIRLSTGIAYRFRYFSLNCFSSNLNNELETKNAIGSYELVNETSLFLSTIFQLTNKIRLNGGLRLSYFLTDQKNYFIPEPRLRISFNENTTISYHINYARLSQSDHSVEGSSTGLRTLLWLPISENLGPEVTDVFSCGIHGHNFINITWALDGYYKINSNMVDFKPGASFIFDTSFVDMLDQINGRAYGIEASIIKKKGKITGSLSYTYSRSKREWISPEGTIWIPSGADRPHNFNFAIKYYFKPSTSFGLYGVYQSGAPATIYMHNTSFGDFFETKNNIRYFDYHRLDFSFRHVIYKRRFSTFLDASIYNIYNHKNTFYFKQIYDEKERKYYFKNISLFPIMPSITVSLIF